jgi:signal transduction histidine kinase
VDAPAGAPAEIAQFADAFREMLRQLGHSREQLAKSAQLAAVGRLSASVVHELRNPLSGIRMNAQLLAGSVPPDAAKSFTLIVREIDRMDLYLQELLALASGAGAAAGKPVPAEVALAEPVRSVTSLLAGRLRHARVEAEVALAPGLPSVLGDANGIRQVILNLMLNALEAMPDGGRIRLTAEMKENGELRIENNALKAEGKGLASCSCGTESNSPFARHSSFPVVRFSVADSGTGVMLPEPGTDIFAPFTSTRPKGTGLGLYICRQLVEGMGGRIGYDSSADGAIFWFELPAAGKGDT